MTDSTLKFAHLDWDDIGAQLDAEGYALLPGILSPADARDLSRQYLSLKTLRHVELAADDLGHGDVMRLGLSLPMPWANWRAALYRHLVPIANRWNATLGIACRYPEDLATFIRQNHDEGQTEPMSHLSRLAAGDYLALSQNNAGEHVFPMQIVALLSEPGVDFEGGEFVLAEQRPRMQSRPMVLPLKLGDVAIISTAQRPFKGSSGYYRVNIKHAISRVRSGERIGLALYLHDSP
ncbi:hypothetical protein GQ57_19085 [Burkholderia sp. MSh2]|uniref:Prolyl 4-hydroxylase n=1 Tax=Burkholderia paludis TaxID=1506587 RepID=A0A6J5DJI8_9BURK|nr:MULTISPECIES: 2OG-Fe(II) oxygenase [Burkholderia]KEZ04293.1 hypothetical protein GQ57_19085 [Burkholderia sp. MSh2]CAB3753391.1 hypothetical protein LMG30113_01963 [Burkholderia paludis]VWB67187.1 prolyl 4-hydroxylase [Burkholderia paludis]